MAIRKIKTRTFSKKANEMLNSVIGQLSDGIWENSNSMNKYWLFASINTDIRGENIIEVKSENYMQYCSRFVCNGFYDMSDDQIREFFAKKIKQIAKIELKDNNKTNEWKRNNTEFKSCYLNCHEDISIADAYLCYEILLGRTLSHWSITQIEDVIGEARTDEEVRIAKKQNELYIKYVNTNKAIYTEFDTKINEIKAKMEEEIAKLKEERYNKLDENTKNYDDACNKLKSSNAA